MGSCLIFRHKSSTKIFQSYFVTRKWIAWSPTTTLLTTIFYTPENTKGHEDRALLWVQFVRLDPLPQYFTHAELKRLNKQFGHPHTDKLYNLLKRVDISNVDYSTRYTLKDITFKCNASLWDDKHKCKCPKDSNSHWGKTRYLKNGLLWHLLDRQEVHTPCRRWGYQVPSLQIATKRDVQFCVAGDAFMLDQRQPWSTGHRDAWRRQTVYPLNVPY